MDFASAKAVDELLDYCLEKELPLVLCTTGLTEEQLKRAEDASKRIPVLRSANMSLGVNLLLKLIQDAAKVLGNAGFDMEIVEKHHNQLYSLRLYLTSLSVDSHNLLMRKLRSVWIVLHMFLRCQWYKQIIQRRRS